MWLIEINFFIDVNYLSWKASYKLADNTHRKIESKGTGKHVNINLIFSHLWAIFRSLIISSYLWYIVSSY